MNYSKKRKKQVQEYNKLRVQFLTDNPFCKVCGRMAGEVHHKAGRIGERLLDVDNFLPVCHDCHVKIEMNPNWAKENGYSKKRI